MARKWNVRSEVRHDADCPVCGFSQEVPGFDCLACETVASMYAADLRRFDPAAFAKAIENAVAAALAMDRRAAA